jgi:proline iminopeptidase
MNLNRRKFLATSVTATITGALSVNVRAAIKYAQPMTPSLLQTDGLNPPGIRTGGIKMVPVVGGKYKVWTKRIGRGPIKVLILHGGPGFSHEYLEALESFLPENGIEKYYYDQLGCNNSDQPDDNSLWTISRYVEEVEEVRRGLQLDHFVLYGHSFGGVLAMEYALKYQKHLRGLVISNMAASTKSYLKRTAALKTQLAPALLNKLNELEAKQAYDSPEYMRIMMEELYPKILCRTTPWPEPLTRAFRHANEKIYEQIQGKSEFLVTGNMKDWDLWDRLHEIKTKTLTIGAKYDEMDPDDMKKMAVLMPNAGSFICENGSHLCMYDDQAAYFASLLKFLHAV